MSGGRALRLLKESGLCVFMRTALGGRAVARQKFVPVEPLCNRQQPRQRKLTARASTREARRLCCHVVLFCITPVAACPRKQRIDQRKSAKLDGSGELGAIVSSRTSAGSGRVGPSFLETFLW
jgi:hypothetical protein